MSRIHPSRRLGAAPRAFLLAAPLVAFAVTQPAPLAAQKTVERVTLEEALERFERQSPDLEIARREVDAARARLATAAGALFNPDVAVVREQLSGGEREYDETTLSLSQTLEIAGQRGLRRETARLAVLAAEARLAAERLRLAFEVRRAFVRAAAAEVRLEVVERATEVVRGVAVAGRARFEEGDVSAFERSRLEIELALYEDLRARAALDLSRAGAELALLAPPDSFDAGRLLLPAAPLEDLHDSGPVEGATEIAGRPDVRAAELEVAAARARLALERRERIGDLTLSGGYKDQSDGLRGGVLGLAVPLPLLNRNAGPIAEARADLAAAEARRDRVVRAAEADVRRARETRAALADQARRVEGLLAETEGLLETARIAYGEGEMSLVELLDAAEAYRTSRELALGLLESQRIATYDLERATGGTVPRPSTDPTNPPSEDLP